MPVGHIFTIELAEDYLHGCPSEVRQAWRHEPEELQAATRCVQALEARRDKVDHDGPLWHGWALHAAFLAGIRWQRVRQSLPRQEEACSGSASPSKKPSP